MVSPPHLPSKYADHIKYQKWLIFQLALVGRGYSHCRKLNYYKSPAYLLAELDH